jgi:hypothetical protein
MGMTTFPAHKSIAPFFIGKGILDSPLHLKNALGIQIMTGF